MAPMLAIISQADSSLSEYDLTGNPGFLMSRPVISFMLPSQRLA